MTIKRERAFRECRRESFPFSYALKKIKAKVGFGRINYEKNNNIKKLKEKSNKNRKSSCFIEKTVI